MFHENRSHPRLWWMLFVSWLVLINYHSLQAHSLYVRMLNRRRTRAASTSFFIQKWRVDGKMDVAQRSFPTSESLLMHRLLVKIENSTHFWQATTFITFDHQKTSSITVTHEQDYWKKIREKPEETIFNLYWQDAERHEVLTMSLSVRGSKRKKI